MFANQGIIMGSAETIPRQQTVNTHRGGVPMRLYGYRRKNGRVGIRNHVLVIPTSVCAAETALRISSLVDGTVALTHGHGCCQVGADHEQTVRTLAGFGQNANVAAVLVVSLGCEGIRPETITAAVRDCGKPAAQICIQECGGTLRATEEGAAQLSKMAQQVAQINRTPMNISELILGLECGGSDFTSGIAANPVVGMVSDMLLDLGGTSILSETTELIGAEHLLAKRAVSPETASCLLSLVKKTEERALAMGVDIRGTQPTPGNLEGGITTIEEKSLGCIHKAGTARLDGVLEYAQTPPSSGFYFMDTPGQDIESVTGMIAGGAQIIIFTTGRGTPTGSPIAPVIKVTGNSRTYHNMPDNIDFNAGIIMDRGVPLREVAEDLFKIMLAVCNGRLTKAEIHKHHEFGIFRVGFTF